MLRMDQDSTAAKDAHEKLLAKFARHEYDIMVGTQMVAKGLDFEDVTLVGVLGIDSLLFTQAFGPTRRCSASSPRWWALRPGEDPGFAIIQTTDPRQPRPQPRRRAGLRRLLRAGDRLPQAGPLPALLRALRRGLLGPKEIEVARAAARFLGPLRPSGRAAAGPALRVLGPTPGNIEKINENYRYKLTIKCRADKRFRDLVRQTLGLYEQEKLPSKATVWWICILTVIFEEESKMAKIMLNDLLHFNAAEVPNVRVKFNICDGSDDPLELYKTNPDWVNVYWLLGYKDRHDFSVGQTAVCLLRFRRDKWLLTTIKKITGLRDVTEAWGMTPTRGKSTSSTSAGWWWSITTTAGG